MDRLLLLLDTGSSPSVRNTAAKQLAQLAVRSVISDVTIVEDDIKTGATRQQIQLTDSTAWAELLAVVARVRVQLIYTERVSIIFSRLFLSFIPNHSNRVQLLLWHFPKYFPLSPSGNLRAIEMYCQLLF